MANPSCRRLFRQAMRRAFSFARPRAGRSSAARIAMMAITTSNSISVKPSRRRQRRPRWNRILKPIRSERRSDYGASGFSLTALSYRLPRLILAQVFRGSVPYPQHVRVVRTVVLDHRTPPTFHRHTRAPINPFLCLSVTVSKRKDTGPAVATGGQTYPKSIGPGRVWRSNEDPSPNAVLVLIYKH